MQVIITPQYVTTVKVNYAQIVVVTRHLDSRRWCCISSVAGNAGVVKCGRMRGWADGQGQEGRALLAGVIGV